MAQSTRSSIVIAADAASIMDIIADVEAYPEWIPGIEHVSAQDPDDAGRPGAATFTGNLGLIKDTYTVAYEWSDAEVSWHLTEGDKLNDLHGTYTCVDRGEGTEVTYALEVDLAVPVVGLLRRRGEKVIVDAALKGLKKRAEA